MDRNRSALALLAALAALTVTSVDAMKGFDTLEVGGFVFGRWDTFGFLSGGHMSLDMQLLLPNQFSNEDFTWILVCNSAEVDAVLSLDQDEICNAQTFQGACFAVAAFGNGNATALPIGNLVTWSVDKDVSVADTYYFLAASCTPYEMDFTLQWHYTNPGGEELSSEQIALKPSTVAFVIMWLMALAFICVTSGYAWYKGRPFVESARAEALGLSNQGRASSSDTEEAITLASPVRRIHYAMIFTPMLAVITTAIYRSFMLDASATGTLNTGLHTGAQLVSDAGATALMCIILLVSRGWQVTRLSLAGNEIRHVVFLTSLYLLSILLWQSFTGFITLTAIIVVDVFLVRYVFASVSWRLRMLRSFRDYVRTLFGSNGAGGGGGAALGSAYQGAGSAASIAQAASAAHLGGHATADGRGGAHPNGMVVTVDGQDYVYNASGDLVPLASEAAAVATAAPANSDSTGDAAVAVASGRSTAGQASGAGGYARLAESADHHDQQQEQAAAATTGGGGIGRWWTRIVGDPSQVPNGLDTSTTTGGGRLTQRQIHLLSWFRTAILIYIMSDAMLQLWNMVGWSITPVPAYVMSELLQWSMVMYLAWVFRAQPDVRKTPLFDPRGYGYMDPLLAGGGGAGGEEGSLANQGGGAFTGGYGATTMAVGGPALGSYGHGGDEHGARTVVVDGVHYDEEDGGDMGHHNNGSSSSGGGGAALGHTSSGRPMLLIHNPDSTTLLAEDTGAMHELHGDHEEEGAAAPGAIKPSSQTPTQLLRAGSTGASSNIGGGGSGGPTLARMPSVEQRQQAMMAYTRTFFAPGIDHEGVATSAYDEQDSAVAYETLMYQQQQQQQQRGGNGGGNNSQ